MTRINLFLLIFLLTGCATPEIRYEIKEVKIPIPVECKTPVPASPDFNFPKLKIDDTVFDKTKALLADRLLHEAYQKELLAALESCK